MSELLPCPFCSAEPEILSDGRRTWGLVQHNDGCLFPTYPKHEIPKSDFAAWNTRAERTCEDANTRFNAWTCSECKCTLLLMFDDFGEPSLSIDGVADVPHYCPNCGAKVVGE